MPSSSFSRAARRALVALALLAVPLAVSGQPASACVDCPLKVFQAEATTGVQVNGTYQPLVGNFAGDENTDILWYAPGTGVEPLWVGTSVRGVFAKSTLSVRGTYRPLIGNFAGDSYDDILWYAPGTAPDALWVSVEASGPFKSVAVNVNGTFQPFVLRNDGLPPAAAAPATERAGRAAAKGLSSIAWYAPGSAADVIWDFTSASLGSHTSTPMAVPGSPQPIVLGQDGDGRDDVFFYTPGSGYDAAWRYLGDGLFAVTAKSVSGTFVPRPIGLGSDEDILWVRPGAGGDAYWQNVGGAFTGAPVEPVTAGGTAVSFGYEAAYLYDDSGPDQVISSRYVNDALDTDVPYGAQILRGDFDGDGGRDMLAYRPGTAQDRLYSGYGGL